VEEDPAASHTCPGENSTVIFIEVMRLELTE
jgi:hypothetical protein